MTKFTRKNAWNQHGTFDNPDLFWYAKGVDVMQKRTLDNKNSWWFYAAIHGKNLPFWNTIPEPPKVPTTPLPTQSIQDQFWDQCQHQSWYFPPWHRGYLIALEDQIRTAVISLGGPGHWALPYWNYFGPDSQYKIPPAFSQSTFPDGGVNPLYLAARYGPKGDGDIYINLSQVNQSCQTNTIYTGSNPSTPSPGYGGPSTGFSHGGGVSGNLESNPHNLVHVQIGGRKGQVGGLMSYPETAGLDPIFYLHHANIDRMWAAWNQASNLNPSDANWLNGPIAIGEREFVMPMSDGAQWVYSPSDVNSLSQLDYDYDDLTTGIPSVAVNPLARRLSILGAETEDTPEVISMNLGTNSELIGANDGKFQLGGTGSRTTVILDNEGRENVSRSLMSASTTNIPDQVYLQLENVTGKMDANILEVNVNDQFAGHISLFGLGGASSTESHTGGGGLTFILNITDIIDNLHLENALDSNTLDISIQPDGVIPEDEIITIGRVSVYREQHEL